jgi:hypothetical protein
MSNKKESKKTKSNYSLSIPNKEIEEFLKDFFYDNK